MWLQVAVVFAVALAVRLVNLDRDGHIDEFFHILAARSWASEGTLRIADGSYHRAALYTMALGEWFRLFGDSLASARITSALAGSLWVAAVWFWTRRVAGSAAAWLAAGLFAFDPVAIWLSQFTRFYAVHGLLFWLAAMAVYALFTEPPRARSLALAAGAAVCLGVALLLQLTTVIGLLALGLWAAGALARAWFLAELSPRTRWAGIAVAVVLALVVAAGFLATGLAAELWHTYREATYWNEALEGYEAYYFNLFLGQYPVLWSLLPVAALVAVAGWPRPALFVATVFGAAFLLHSFAGNKLERYIYYAVPFLFVLWGMALARVLPPLFRWLLAAIDRALVALRLDGPDWLWRPARWAALAGAVGFLLIANPALVQTLEELVNPPEPERTEGWEAARAALGPLLRSVDVVVTTDELRSFYYLGRSDILLNKNRLMEIPDPAEFKIDRRTGKPIISSFESFKRVMNCYPTGLFITEERYWGGEEQGGPRVAALLERQGRPVTLPEAENPSGPYRLVVYRWDRAEPADTARCAALPGYVAANSKG